MTASVERFRSYVYLLVLSGFDGKSESNVNLAGIVQQTLTEARRVWDEVAEQSIERQAERIRSVLRQCLIDEAHSCILAAYSIDQGYSADLLSERFSNLLVFEKSPPGKQLSLKAKMLVIADALLQLPDDDRQAVELYHFHGKRLGEVADILNRSKKYIASILYRTTRNLKDQLETCQT